MKKNGSVKYFKFFIILVHSGHKLKIPYSEKLGNFVLSCAYAQGQCAMSLTGQKVWFGGGVERGKRERK